MRVNLAILPHASEDAVRDDESLVQQVRLDPSVFEVLYRRYRDRIYWYLRARTPSEDDALDLTQHVFLQAIERLEQYRPKKGSFAAWLFAIARHAATDFHRRRHATVDWEGLPAALHPVDGHDVEIDTVQREALARLDQLLRALPRDKREILVLRFAGELTIAEIAAVIGRSPEATRKQLTRILQTLEDRYDDSAQ
jgi:RNA polymerase sigma-70 factor (ECF subfamily)